MEEGGKEGTLMMHELVARISMSTSLKRLMKRDWEAEIAFLRNSSVDGCLRALLPYWTMLRPFGRGGTISSGSPKNVWTLCFALCTGLLLFDMLATLPNALNSRSSSTMSNSYPVTRTLQASSLFSDLARLADFRGDAIFLESIPPCASMPFHPSAPPPLML